MMIKKLFLTTLLIHCMALKSGTVSDLFFEGDLFRAPFSGKFIPATSPESLQTGKPISYKAGQLIGYIEFMKSKLPIYAPKDGVLSLPGHRNGNIFVEAKGIIGTFSTQTPSAPKNSETFSPEHHIPTFSQTKNVQTESVLPSNLLAPLKSPSEPSEILPLERSAIVLQNVKIKSFSKEENIANTVIPPLHKKPENSLLQKENSIPSLLANLMTQEDLEEILRIRKFSLSSLKSIIQEYFKINLLTFMTFMSLFYLGLISIFVLIRKSRQ